MKDGPDITRIATLIGDPARGNMLAALMSGKALTATELAHEAGVTPQTASSHLAKLQQGGLIKQDRQGRHRYFVLAGPDVAAALEALMGLAAGKGHLRTRTGPNDPALRDARVCYNHLAGAKGVQMYRTMLRLGHFATSPDGLVLTDAGRDFVRDLGIDLDTLPPSRSPMCRECLDWSMRQHHLAGRLGRAMLSHFENDGWIRREAGNRVVRFTSRGTARFQAVFS